MIESIMFPVVIVTVIGALSGVLLSVASIILAVPVDETQEKVRAALPGVNCGACGYAGCDGYAGAVSKGEAKVNLCVPGGNGVKDQLAGIMGVEADDVRRMAAFVKCGGNCDNVSVKMEYAGIRTCAAANQIFGGPSACTYGCMGYGDCVAVCQYGAIQVVNGVSVVDSDKCAGCTKCIAECPKGIIYLYPAEKTSAIQCSSHDKGAQVRKACTVGCIGCSICVKSCPRNAISMDNLLAVIDYDKCNSCGVCAEACPQKCISLR